MIPHIFMYSIHSQVHILGNMVQALAFFHVCWIGKAHTDPDPPWWFDLVVRWPALYFYRNPWHFQPNNPTQQMFANVKLFCQGCCYHYHRLWCSTTQKKIWLFPTWYVQASSTSSFSELKFQNTDDPKKATLQHQFKLPSKLFCPMPLTLHQFFLCMFK